MSRSNKKNKQAHTFLRGSLLKTDLIVIRYSIQKKRDLQKSGHSSTQYEDINNH